MFGIENFNEKIVDFANFNPSSLLDALVFGGAVMLIGILAVFSVLCILWLFMFVFKLLFHDLPNKKKPKKVTEVITKVSEPQAVEKHDDEELIAVITAAIAMAESEDSGMKFRVVSFKRI